MSEPDLRLSAVRALLGQIPPSLRAVSVDTDAEKVYFRCIFDGTESDHDRELLSEAAALVIADFPSPRIMDEQYQTVKPPGEMRHLRHMVFLRHEAPK